MESSLGQLTVRIVMRLVGRGVLETKRRRMYDVTQAAMPEPAWLRSSAVRGAYHAGLRAWPGLSVSEDEFARHLASVVPAGAEGLPAGLHCEDLFLACGCAKGDPRAIEYFSARVLSILPVVVARMSASPAFLEEL